MGPSFDKIRQLKGPSVPLAGGIGFPQGTIRSPYRPPLIVSFQGPKFKKTWSGESSSEHSPESEQFRGTTHKNVLFPGKKGQKVHPNFAMEFHCHAFCIPEKLSVEGLGPAINRTPARLSDSRGPCSDSASSDSTTEFAQPASPFE